MNRTDLVIFDCDGVLVDSEPISNRVWCQCLRTLGWDLDDAASHEMFVGRSMADCVRLVEARLGITVPETFVPRFREVSFEAFRRELKPIPGVREAIEAIPAPRCVASSGPHDKIRLNLTITGLIDHFEGRIFSAADVPRGKPHPDLFLHAATSLGTPPTRCVVVEDSVPGVRAAIAAGMRALGYARSANAAALTKAGAEVFDDMAQLPMLVR